MKKILVFLSLLLCITSSMYADDAFSVDNVTLPKNGEADVVVKFSLGAGSTCSGYTFWLQVPEQLAFVTYVKNDNTYVTYTAGDCYDETPNITPNINAGYLKVGCLTANSDPIIGQTGTLVTFRLKVIGNVNVGDVLNGKLINGTISEENGAVHNVSDANFTITIGEPVDTHTILDENSTTAPTASNGPVDVRVKRTINAGSWSSICLPFAMTEAQTKEVFGNDVQLGDFTGYTATKNGDNVVGITVNFSTATSIVENHPYIIKVSSPVTEFTMDNVSINPEEKPRVEYKSGKKFLSAFVGTYVADFDFYNDAGDYYPLFLSGNKFYYATEYTQHMKGFRAYFAFKDNLPEAEGNSVKMFVDISGEETGIENLNANDNLNNTIYDLSGRSVNKAQKGVYIVNGKKVLY